MKSLRAFLGFVGRSWVLKLKICYCRLIQSQLRSKVLSDFLLIRKCKVIVLSFALFFVVFRNLVPTCQQRSLIFVFEVFLGLLHFLELFWLILVSVCSCSKIFWIAPIETWEKYSHPAYMWATLRTLCYSFSPREFCYLAQFSYNGLEKMSKNLKLTLFKCGFFTARFS
jgi:hypothetical protein